ncbi:hypothetical protein C0971_09470 [Bacillus methanolicus]|uniref:hypothetical protein n=1 Tax=Bacillus methanolicus TaxID=1471 RepID=UPI0020108079|nr:hypothetical protein [Bacillus methanolicus]UQD52223.1 hypothetical protein C0971_09470 [Bacillus methanolicus]
MESVAGKEHILKILDNEISKLILSYEKEIYELTAEKDQLLHQVMELKLENQMLREKLASTPKKETNIDVRKFIEKLSGGVTYDIIDEWCLSTSVVDAIFLLASCKKLFEDKDYEKVFYILELLGHNPNPLLHEDAEVRKLFSDIISLVLAGDFKNYEAEFDGVYSLFLTLLMTLSTTKLKDSIVEHLKHFYTDILDNVLYLNNPEIINELLRLFLIYGMEDELREALQQIVEVEWEFLDSSINEKEFVFILWYAFLYNFDQQLIDKAKESLQWLKESCDELALYFCIHESVNLQRYPDGNTYRQCIQKLKLTEILTELEKSKILQKVELMLKPLLARPVPPIIYEKVIVIDPSYMDDFVHRYQFSRKKVTLPLYKQKNDNLISRFFETEAYVTPSGNKAYLTTEELDEILQANTPFVLKIKKHEGILPGDKLILNNTIAFPWPNTELKENQSNQETKTLKELSDLKKLGYQITGLNRQKRWDILKKAVPQLGLKKVAYTIAYNVKLRKGQKDGLKKYSYAISEWEHDLSRLKKEYYKKDFTWPNT